LDRQTPTPILDTRLYNIEFPDGHTAAYAANVIEENMYAQGDEEGHTIVIMDEIVDHKNAGYAVSSAKQYATTKNGRKHMR
jgi:hypothetical protein